MYETLLGLVSHYSPSGKEQGAVEWLVAHMKHLGYDETFIDDAGNAVGVMGQGSRQIVLLGHIDTVPGEIPVRVDEGILYGRGAVDAKGALACFCDAAAEFGAVEGWQVVVIGAVEEERDSKGAYHVVDRYKPEFAIAGEPNHWNRVALGYKGSAWAEITARREQAHSAGGGQTACEAAFETWQAILAYTVSYNQTKERIFEHLQPSLSGMESGKTEFEQWARLTVGTRLPLEFSTEDWYTKLETVCVGAEVTRVGKAIPAWVSAKNTALVRAFLSSIRGQGGTPAFVVKTGTSDVNIVAPQWQCPAIVYGPGDSGLDHTPGEKLELEEYEQAVKVVKGALEKLCRGIEGIELMP